jgi:hypothetical protein
MAGNPPTPLPARPSEADRERIATTLRERSAEGRISLDTFSERLERLYAAGSQAELEELVSDVRPAGALRRRLLHAIERASQLHADFQAAWARPRLPVVALPADPARHVVLGRGRHCDLVVSDATVSRTHAELRHDGARWLLCDLGSRNGTRVNGMLVVGNTEVRPSGRARGGGALTRRRRDGRPYPGRARGSGSPPSAPRRPRPGISCPARPRTPGRPPWPTGRGVARVPDEPRDPRHRR